MTDLSIGDDHFAEQFPLSPIDDFMVHQTPDPVRVSWTGDPRAYERYWMIAHDTTGEVMVATGGSIYPNLDRAEAYAIVVRGGRHTAVRSFRPLGVDRTDLRVGPIAPVIVRGLREWRYVLEPNDQGISWDLTFTDTTRQVFREPLSDSAHGTPSGRRNDVTAGFEGFGSVSGWVEVDGERVELGEGSFGTRDRHWGTGRGVGGPTMSLGGRLHVGVNGNAFVPFADWTLWGDRVYYPFGHATPGATKVLKPTRRLRFDPETQVFVEGVVDYRLVTGETRQLHYERIGEQTAYLRCGMYGGTPDGDIHQGSYDGPAMTEGESYDLTDLRQRIGLRGLDEHLCRVTCDGETVLGVYQTIDPVAFEQCTAGRPGWAFL
ncbi:hypothetical protein [Geodermatophilus sp. Leaf369]|uniref:hypothetical protein n=1 Tax=Geodermatophilus sp. Leaf369 TaxID=1736354 RepID=UPI0009EB6CA7|nr:hypothetical protein [Geodermatophilus sp. Leaf369]